MKKIKFIDLFAGLGGIRLGFEQAFNEQGFETECVLTSEIKPSAIKALKENFRQDNLVGDIREIESNDIPDFDFLLAGFPCQAFSTAGKQHGFADTRGTLFFEVERILKDKKPFAFILENVEGLVNHDKGKTFNVILNSLNNLGYQVSWKILDSQDFGVPQQRKRIFIVGTLTEKINLEDFQITKKILNDILEKDLETVDSHFTRCLLNHYNLSELYGKAIKDKRGGKNNIHSWDIELKGSVSKEQKEIIEKIYKERRKKHWAEEISITWMDGMPLTLNQIKTFCDYDNLEELLEDLVIKGYLVKEYPKELVEKITENGIQKVREQDLTKEIGYNIVAGRLSFEFTKILDSYSVSPTLVATDISHIGVIDNGGIRRLTIREGLRLFGYPENYNLSMFQEKDLVKVFDLLGNTVAVPVIKEISSKLVKIYKNLEKEVKK